MAILFLLVLMSNFPCWALRLPNDMLYYEPFDVPSGGPGSYAFNSTWGGPYTGVNDGRILKYEGCDLYFVGFAFTSPKRTNALCDGTSDPKMGPICGRPIGLGIKYETGELFITDAHYGLCVVGPNGGLATQLATAADGVPFKLPGGLDIDQHTGTVYFTDGSIIYNLNYVTDQVDDQTLKGRLIKYDPETKQVTVLLRNLAGVGGAAVGRDGSFILVSEYSAGRILKYWLKGPKAGTSEILLRIKGPANIKRTPLGDFWVAATFQTPIIQPIGIRIDEFGKILQVMTFRSLFNSTFITEVYEYHGTFHALYVGSMNTTFGGIYKPFVDQVKVGSHGQLKICPPKFSSY